MLANDLGNLYEMSSKKSDTDNNHGVNTVSLSTKLSINLYTDVILNCIVSGTKQHFNSIWSIM